MVETVKASFQFHLKCPGIEGTFSLSPIVLLQCLDGSREKSVGLEMGRADCCLNRQKTSMLHHGMNCFFDILPAFRVMNFDADAQNRDVSDILSFALEVMPLSFPRMALD